MVTVEKNKIAQNEQNTTLESGVETSQKNKDIDEAVLDSQKDQEILGVNQDINVRSQNLEEGVIDSNKNQAISTMEQGVKTDTQALEQEVKTKTPLDLANEKIIEIEAINDNENLKKMANIRIANCKSLLDWLKWDRKSKRDLKDKVNRAIHDMERIIDDEHIYKIQQNEYKNCLCKIIYDYYTNREPARQLIMMWKRVPVINWTADTKREAKRDNSRARDNAEYQIDVSELKKNTALYTMIWVSAYDRGNYCDFIWQWWIAKWHPVYIQHTEWFRNVNMYNPDLYRAITPEWQVTYDKYCQSHPQCQPTYSNWYNPSRKYRTWNVWEDIIHTIQDIRWKEVTPQQREARKKIWNLWALAWCVALGVGIIRALFPWRDPSTWKRYRTNRWRVLWLWAGIYGITHYKEIKNMALDALNLDPDNYVARKRAEKAREEAQANMWLSQSEAQDLVDAKITYPTLVATTIGVIPIKDLIEQKIVEEKNWKLVLNKTNYAIYVETMALALWRSDKDKQEILDKVASNGATELISNGLNYCWFNTLSDLNNLKKSNTSTLMDSATFKTKYKTQIDVLTRQTWIFSNMAKQWFIPVWLDQTLKILENYDSDKNENEQILQRLKSWLLKMDPEKQKPYDVANLLKSPYIDLMDLDKMTMNWFKNWANEVVFSSYWELFDAVYITERIKYIFKWRTDAKDAVPFHVNLLWQIEFNNREWYELHKTDTTVISLKKLKTDLSTIMRNREAYNKYLNDWRIKTL